MEKKTSKEIIEFDENMTWLDNPERQSYLDKEWIALKDLKEFFDKRK